MIVMTLQACPQLAQGIDEEARAPLLAKIAGAERLQRPANTTFAGKKDLVGDGSPGEGSARSIECAFRRKGRRTNSARSER